MIPVVLLAKISVFEMLCLESEIQQTNGPFAFCQCYRHWWPKKLMKTGLVFHTSLLQYVILAPCCNVRMIYLSYLPFIFQFYKWSSSFVYFRKTEKWWISPRLHPISVPYKENKSTCKFKENWQVQFSEKVYITQSGKLL